MQVAISHLLIVSLQIIEIIFKKTLLVSNFILSNKSKFTKNKGTV